MALPKTTKRKYAKAMLKAVEKRAKGQSYENRKS
jgi:hypothetical protein